MVNFLVIDKPPVYINFANRKILVAAINGYLQKMNLLFIALWT